MEEDSASLMFDFDLDLDPEVQLIENPYFQAHANLSHEKNGEKGSSSGSNLPASNSKQKLTASSAHANNENVDASNEIAPSLSPPLPSTVIPQANENPTKESLEFPIQAGEKNNEAGGDEVNANSPENNHSQESSSNLKLLASVAELSPSVTSPFNTPFSGAPTKPSFTTMNNEKFGSSSKAFPSSNSMAPVELGPTTGSNQPFLFNQSSSHNNAQQNLTGSTNLGFCGNIVPSLLNETNVLQNNSNFFFLRPQPNQFPAANIFNSQFDNSTMSLGSSVPLRQQNLAGESNQLLPFAANTQETQDSINSMLPAVSVPLGLRNQVSSGDQGRLVLGHDRQMMPNIMDTQQDNSLFLRQSSMLSRAKNFDLQGLLNEPIRSIRTYPTCGSSLQGTNQLLNSLTQQDIFGGNNPRGSIPQLELSLNRSHEQSFQVRRNCASNLYDIGESSLSSSLYKRPKISNFMGRGPTSQSRQNELEKLLADNPFNHPRPNKNTLYDPIFESLGLPIDPHLRLFNSNR